MDAYSATPLRLLQNADRAEKQQARPTVEEIRNHLRKCRDSGQIRHRASVLKLLETTALPLLTRIVHRIWDTDGQDYVQEWEQTRKIPLFKGKGKNKRSTRD